MLKLAITLGQVFQQLEKSPFQFACTVCHNLYLIELKLSFPGQRFEREG